MTDRILAHRHRLVNDENSKWWTLGAMCFALFMIMLDNTIVNVALPSIQKDLGASISGLEWTINGYTLSFAVLLATGGRLGDIFGRRRMFLFGVTIFALSSATAGLAPDATWLVISRVVQTVRPSAIYTHSLHDVHQDHRNAHRAAMVAAREVGRVYCFQSPSATVDFRPNRFVTIDDEVERKLMAIKAFASQTEVRAYLAPDLIKSTARYWSRFGDGLYAEAFEVIREAAMTAGQPGGPVRNESVALPDARPTVLPAGAARQDTAESEPARSSDDRPEVPYATP